ncbi:NAD-dependent epimerase/dehydratase family protein [Algoriphagus sp.]|uniref:NAD-dependent epimerase/dehydratase family protein n=1 Tax=Algoriphagus sp. TaxID=1872435 RepID=UPI00391DC6AA
MSKIRTVLISGANGLLGQSLCKLLVSEGFEVVGLVHNLPSKKIPNVTYLSIDLETEWNQNQLPEQVDAIVHLAQSAHFRDFPKKAMNVFKVNIASTAKLLDYGRQIGVKSFVFASSGGVYGNGNQAFHENSAISSPGLLGYYLGSKLSGEVLSQSYSDVFTVNVLRFFFIYGPNQKMGMLIPRLMESVINHRPITLHGQQGIRINPIHVADAAIATRAAMLSESSTVYNISGPEVLSLKTIAEQMGIFCGIAPEFSYLEGEPRDLIGDNSAMKRDLHIPSRLLVDHLDEVKNLVTS